MNPRQLILCTSALLVFALIAGCTSTVSARKVIALDRFHRVFVEKRLNENNRLDEIFVTELKRLGLEASSGPMTMLPEKIDLVLTYDSRWEWDFKNYLLELNLELHTVHPRKKVADARYYQPSIKTKSPDDVIRQLLADLFTKP